MIDKEYIKDKAILDHATVLNDERADRILRNIRSNLRGNVCLRGFVHNKIKEELKA